MHANLARRTGMVGTDAALEINAAAIHNRAGLRAILGKRVPR
jgi:hypothetical protein